MKRFAASLWVWPAALLLIGACGDDAKPTSDAGATDAKTPDAPLAVDGGEESDGPVVTTDGPANDGPASDKPVTTDAPVNGDAPKPGPDGPVLPTALSIGPAGGKIVSADGRLTLEVPQGSLDRRFDFSILAVNPAPAGAVGPVYDIEPSTGVFFPIPALVTYKPAGTDLAGLTLPDVRLATVTTGGSWVQLQTTLTDQGAGTVRARTDHPARFGLIAGVCTACTDPVCDATTCRFGAVPATPGSGVAGVCKPYGKGCSKCFPACDGDGDGFCAGNPGSDQPGGDCDDNNADINPNGREICGNGKDDNCNGHVDEGCAVCAADTDCAGSEACVSGVCQVCDAFCDPTMNCRFGVIDGMPGSGLPGKCISAGKGCLRCTPACDADGDGQCTTAVPNVNGIDCNDADANVYSGAPERCGNGIDDDCDGMIDEGCNSCSQDTDCAAGSRCTNGLCALCGAACDVATCRTGGTAGDPNSGTPGKCVPGGNGCSICVPTCDGDGDGACPGPGGDCNDGNAKIGPNAIEICGNNVDENCNGHIDEGCKTCSTDADCPAGLEACVNGVCNTCDSFCAADNCHFGPDTAQVAGRCVTFGNGCNRCVPGCDMDGDGYCTTAVDGVNGLDCNDADAKVNSAAPEVCGNNVDDDCNGKIDDGCNTCRNTSDTCNATESCAASAQ